MNNSLNLFFILIRISLEEKNRSDFKPSAEDWEKIYQLAQQQTLLGILYNGIKYLEQHQRPPKHLLLQWYMFSEKMKAENDKLNRHAIKLQNYFAKEGFRSCVLKGQGIAMLYPHPCLRNCGDIDLLLEGERLKIVEFVHKKYPGERVLYHHIDFPYDEVSVELHTTPSWMFCYFTNKRLQSFFKRHRPDLFQHEVEISQVGNLTVPTLAFNRIYILVHIYRHLFGEGIGLRQMMDYYYVLKQGFTERERLETLKVLKDLKMIDFAASVMYVLQTVFGLENEYLLLEPQPRKGKFLLEEVMKAGNFGQFDPSITIGSKDSLWSLFCKRNKRNFHFLRYYPSEVFWCPLFKIWHYCWRKWHGWL